MFLDQTPWPARLLPPRAIDARLHLAYESTLAATDDLVGLYRQDDFQTYDGKVTRPVLESVASGTPGGTAFFLDGETLRATVGLRAGITPRLEVGIEIPFLSHGAGFLDSFIEGYHARLNLPDGGRPAFARDRFRAGYVGDGESVFFDHAPGGVRLGDLVLAARAALVRGAGGRPAVAGALSLKLPTGDADRLHGSGSADLGASLQVSRRFGRSILHAGYAYTWLGSWELAPGLPLEDPRSLYAAWSFRARERSALLVQVLRSSGPFPYRPGSDIGRAAQEIAVGLRHRLRDGTFLEWGVIENLDRHHAAPDVGAFLGLTSGFTLGGAAPAAPPR
jgi:hypothetical protein